ncbi:MAG TPA: PAS domain S-box protein [Gemmataceae bacterium]|nr:PAS domain S-box protein [Gemmataceae bacterium]
MRGVRQFLRPHRVPLLAVALAAVHSLLFWSLGPRVPLGLFIAAVMVSAWQGGMRSSVLATALSTLFLAVIGHYQAPGPGEDLVLRLGLFVLVGLIAGYLSQQCQQAIRAVEHVHDILGGSGIAIISADTAGQVTSLNPLARTLTGLGEAAAHGRPLEQVFHVVHGAARQPLALPAPGTAQELPEGALLLGSKGGETAVEGTIGPVRDGDGRSAGVMVVFRESGGRTQAWQELRQRADRFRALAGYAPAGLMVLDAEGRCVFCNPAAQSACACTADESLGEGWSRHVQPQDRERLISDWLKAVVSKAPFADEFRVVTEPGSVRWLRVRSAPMLADGGDVLGHVAVLEEVTDRKRAEEALADARRESEEHLLEWSASEKKAEEALRTARAEAEGRLQEQTAARTSAEESARRAQGHLEERGTALRRAEEALRAAQAAAEQSVREEASRRQQAEDALRTARAEAADELGQLHEQLRRLAAERGSTPEEVRAAARQVRDAWREEVEAVVAMHLDARACLAEELTGHRQALQATRDAHERLQAVVAEKEDATESLRNQLGRLTAEAGVTREAHDRLQALLADRGGSEAALRKELEQLAADAASLRESHDRLQERLVQKEGDEGALRQELDRLRGEPAARRQAEEAHERLRSLLGEKEQREESLRQELDHLRGEAAGRRQAEEAHERLQSLVGEKEQSEESLRSELARLQGDMGERQRAEERLRREKEFLEGVIDGSPAGIFAHDRDGRCRVWNPALERLLGRPRADALGRTASELFPPGDAPHQPDAGAGPATADGGERTGLPAEVVIGRSELLESAHAPIRDPSGEVIGGMALVRVLPMDTTKNGREELAPPVLVGGESQPGRPTNGDTGQGMAPVRLGEIDWLAFN